MSMVMSTPLLLAGRVSTYLPLTAYYMCPQLCYETCAVVLAHKVACEAVRAYKDGRSFAPDVVIMLQNSLAEEDHAVSQSTCMHISVVVMVVGNCNWL